jgi:hypothetical protein
MDIVVWLRSLGLGKYEAAFRENEIDETVLPSLTHETLKELGVTAVGHRVKLLDAIAALRTDAGLVISAYQKCVAATVQRFGGFVAKYMGDGVLVYFGYPQAHEDDAERAVRAGLELLAAIGGLKTHAALQTRVGIATGLVVVGDLIGSGASQEQAIVGETPNLAARLQGVAEPNSVVIAENTRKLVGALFELEDLGSQELKGISGTVRGLERATALFSRKPVRGISRQRPNRACGTGRRTRTATAAVVEGKSPRRSGGVVVW